MALRVLQAQRVELLVEGGDAAVEFRIGRQLGLTRNYVKVRLNQEGL